jgi:Bacterial PH domain
MAIASVTLVTDTPGFVMAGVAALGLILFAGLTWRARPKLAITPAGLTLRGWFRTQLFQRSDIKIIRITEFRRLARKVRLLELETVDGGLVIFSRWDLGTDPLDVLDALTDAGYAGRKKGS